MTNSDSDVVGVETLNGHGLLALVASDIYIATLNFAGLGYVNAEVYGRLKGVAGEVVEVSNI